MTLERRDDPKRYRAFGDSMLKSSYRWEILLISFIAPHFLGSALGRCIIAHFMHFISCHIIAVNCTEFMKIFSCLTQLTLVLDIAIAMSENASR